MSNGRVKYDIRLLFNCCHGENPSAFGAAEWAESCKFLESVFFIIELGKIGALRTAMCSETKRPHLSNYGRPIREAAIENSTWRIHQALVGSGSLRASVRMRDKSRSSSVIYDEVCWGGRKNKPRESPKA